MILPAQACITSSIKCLGKRRTDMPKLMPFRICFVCGVRLTKKNVAGIYNGKFTSYCRPCHAEIAYCKLWRKKPVKIIRHHISDLKRRIVVLGKIIERKETGHPATSKWKAKMKS